MSSAADSREPDGVPHPNSITPGGTARILQWRAAIMTDVTSRRMVFARADDLEQWNCRPLGTVDVLNLKDRLIGRLDGLMLDAGTQKPMCLVIRRTEGAGGRWFLVPVGEAWFDQTQRAVRIDDDAQEREAMQFDPEAFERMSPEEVAEYEKRLLAHVGVRSFECPVWLKPSEARTLPASGASRR